MRTKLRPATATWSECRHPTNFEGSGTYVSDYQDSFGEAPGTWSPYTYDSLNILAYGVKHAGGFGANALTSALNGVSDRKGWTGSVTLDPGSGNRDPATVTIDQVGDQGVFSVDRAWAEAVGAPYQESAQPPGSSRTGPHSEKKYPIGAGPGRSPPPNKTKPRASRGFVE